jgi:hypothetical protein
VWFGILNWSAFSGSMTFSLNWHDLVDIPVPR